MKTLARWKYRVATLSAPTGLLQILSVAEFYQCRNTVNVPRSVRAALHAPASGVFRGLECKRAPQMPTPARVLNRGS
jgi:hypothetical protein